MAAETLNSEAFTFDSADEALEAYHERGWTDGLPIVMPTGERIQAMIAASSLPGSTPVGVVPPRWAEATVEHIAINAVMAGCKPEYMPVLIAGIEAVCTDEFNIHGVMATTMGAAPVMIINGPIRHKLDMNMKLGALGQGNRANATIGRAIRLVLLNVSGATPGELDESTLGHPGKYTYCIAENEEQSPWAPYHVRRGFDAGDSIVTAIPAEAPHNVNDHASTTGEGILTTIAGTISQVGANTIYCNAPYFVAIGPEHAQTLHRDGLSIPNIQAELFERSKVHVSRVSKENQKSYAGMDRLRIGDHYPLTRTPEDIHIVVAGGPGKHSAYIAPFGFTAACSVQVPNF